MDRLLETNVDKRTVFDIENKFKLLQDKNKIIFTEVINLRKELESKDVEMEKA